MATLREKVRQLIDQIDNARAAGSVTNRMLASVLNYFFGDKDVFEELDNKADKNSVYTKTETDTKLASKADKNSVYTKTETDLRAKPTRTVFIRRRRQTRNFLTKQIRKMSIPRRRQTRNLIKKPTRLRRLRGMASRMHIPRRTSTHCWQTRQVRMSTNR